MYLHETFTRDMSRAKKQSIKFGNDPDPIHNHCGAGLQSLTDCLFLFDTSMTAIIIIFYIYRCDNIIMYNCGHTFAKCIYVMSSNNVNT